jgi:hypothetical protein
MEKVNVKSGGTPTGTLFQSWSPHRQRVFAQVFEPQRQALESLGYGLGNLTASSWNGLRIDALPSCSEERSLAAS